MPRKKTPQVPGVKPGGLGGKSITQSSKRPPGLGGIDPETYYEAMRSPETARLFEDAPPETDDWCSIAILEDTDGGNETSTDRDPGGDSDSDLMRPITFVGPDPAHQGQVARITLIPTRAVSHFEMSLLRPDPLILTRVKRGQKIRKSVWWEFEFEGDAPLVRRQRAIMILTKRTFARDETDEKNRELRCWIALHYAARTSPVLVRCARGDAPEKAPVRRLDSLDRTKVITVLARDLHIRDHSFVRTTIDAFATFQAKLNDLPDECLSRLVVDRLDHVLGNRKVRQPL